MSQAGPNSVLGEGQTVVNSITGDSGGALTGAVTITGGATGLTFAGSGGHTLTEQGTLNVAHGGTGDTSLTAYAVLCGGTTATGHVQSVASVGTSGQVLTSNGAASLPTFQSFAAIPFTFTSVTTSPYVVAAGDEFLGVTTSSIPVTLEFPNAPVTGRVYIVKDSTGTASTNNITITTVGGTVTFDGATSYVINTNYASVSLIFDGANYEIF